MGCSRSCPAPIARSPRTCWWFRCTARDATPEAVDAAAATAIASTDLVPEVLAALPVAALPGWDGEGLGARLFDDARVFRPVR